MQLVEVEDGEEDAEEVDQDPDGIQHIVPIRSLRKNFNNKVSVLQKRKIISGKKQVTATESEEARKPPGPKDYQYYHLDQRTAGFIHQCACNADSK